jgi:serpin B
MSLHLPVAGSFLALLFLAAFARAAAANDHPRPLGWSIYDRAGSDGQNLVFSPLSIVTALRAAHAGAAGKTADEIATLLRSSDPQALDALVRRISSAAKPSDLAEHNPVLIRAASAGWLQSGLRVSDKYARDAASLGTKIESVDFAKGPRAAADTINAWVARATDNRIPTLFPTGGGGLDASTRFVITTAVYFKAPWASPFVKGRTKSGDFFAAPDRKVTADLMNRVGRYAYAEDDHGQYVALPYAGGKWDMWLALPPRDGKLSDLESHLAGGDGLRAKAKLARPVTVDVTLPRFRFSRRLDLRPILAAAGMPSAFDPKVADFSGVLAPGQPNLFISAVVHEAMVRVDEEGSEAAAATGIVMRPTAVMPEHDAKVFRADRPFVFAIVDRETGLSVFLGRVTDPSAGVDRAAR